MSYQNVSTAPLTSGSTIKWIKAPYDDSVAVTRRIHVAFDDSHSVHCASPSEFLFRYFIQRDTFNNFKSVTLNPLNPGGRTRNQLQLPSRPGRAEFEHRYRIHASLEANRWPLVQSLGASPFDLRVDGPRFQRGVPVSEDIPRRHNPQLLSSRGAEKFVSPILRAATEHIGQYGFLLDTPKYGFIGDGFPLTNATCSSSSTTVT